MRLSMQSFDRGNELAATHMATISRVLVSPHGGTSILDHIGAKKQITFLASGGGVNPNNLMTTTSLTSINMSVTDTGTSTEWVPLSLSLIYLPGQFTWLPFEDWWGIPVIKANDGEVFSRKRIVEILANRDGGAHFNQLKGAERALATGKSLGWFFGSEDEMEPFEENVLYPSMRTIAQELDEVFWRQFDQIVGEPKIIPADFNRSAFAKWRP